MKLLSQLLIWLLIMPATAFADKGYAMTVGGIAGQFEFSETQIEIIIQDIVNEKLKGEGLAVNLRLFDSEQKLEEAYNKGVIDGVFGDPIIVLKHYDTYQKLSFLNVHYSYAAEKGKLLLLVKKQSKIQTLDQLKHKKIAFYTSNSTEKLFLETQLLRKKLGTIDRFFSKSYMVKTSDLAILDVFFGKADATVVPEYVFETASELNPQLKKQLTVLEVSPPLFTRIVAFRNIPEYEKIYKTLFTKGMNIEKSSGRQYMKLVATHFAELKSVKALIEEHKKLKAQYVK